MQKVCKCGAEYVVEYQTQKKCRPCKQAYDREYHANRSPENKARELALQAQRLDVARQYVWDYLSANPCTICGESDPIVLEFDHLDQNDKVGNIAEMKWSSIATLQEEISKCRVLCANCHRRHTAIQLGWYKDLTR